MIGNGEVWLGGVGNAPPYTVLIIAINNAVPATPTPGSTATRIQFEPGATSAAVEGRLNAGEVKSYILRALAGQTMMVSLDSPQGDVFLTIYGVDDGQPLVRSAAGATYWQGQLPATQDYMILAVAGGEATNFSLQVIIPYIIKFAPGGTSAVVEGNVRAGSIIRYLLRAQAGQTMTVNITSPNMDVLLTIYGLDDGQPLVRSVSGATSWTGTLPATQDYVIDAVSVGGDTSFTLGVTIK